MSIATTEQRPDVSYTSEGDGTIARCTGCDWEAWRPDRHAAQSAASDHKKCRAEDVAFLKRRHQARASSRR